MWCALCASLPPASDHWPPGTCPPTRSRFNRAAPQFGSAKDALNLAGMVAANNARGDHPLVTWGDLETVVMPEVNTGRALLVDVREASRCLLLNGGWDLGWGLGYRGGR